MNKMSMEMMQMNMRPMMITFVPLILIFYLVLPQLFAYTVALSPISLNVLSGNFFQLTCTAAQAMEEGQDYKHWANELFPGGSFGNGAAMRVAPVGLMFEKLWEQARLSSLPTHVHPLGIEGYPLLGAG